jgi:hypothetical protein
MPLRPRYLRLRCLRRRVRCQNSNFELPSLFLRPCCQPVAMLLRKVAAEVTVEEVTVEGNYILDKSAIPLQIAAIGLGRLARPE